MQSKSVGHVVCALDRFVFRGESVPEGAEATAFDSLFMGDDLVYGYCRVTGVVGVLTAFTGG